MERDGEMAEEIISSFKKSYPKKFSAVHQKLIYYTNIVVL
jgi:hypothetical protein